MAIHFSDRKDFSEGELSRLFQSVGWLSARYPRRLVKAMGNASAVFSAWDGGRLVGLVNAVDDTELTAYIHYLLVDPEYQGRQVGGQLLAMMKERYKDYLYLVLISEDAQTARFYEKQGFTASSNGVPMSIVNLSDE